MPDIRIIKVAEGQNVYDLALQYYGSMERAMDIVQDNDFDSLDVRLITGQEINIDFEKVDNPDIVKFYSKIKEGYNPATGDEPVDGQFDDSFSDDFLI